MKCRHCTSPLSLNFLDLGFAPLSNAYLTEDDLQKSEKYYPLKVQVCEHCWLVQINDYTTAGELFTAEYAYFSSTSTLWLSHAKTYAGKVAADLKLDSNSFVVEIASNDGYLLQNFVEMGIPCLGIEPTESTALVCEKKGVPVLREFFNDSIANNLCSENKQADLIIGNNVYAHVPDINDFTRGLKRLLKDGGTITLEFPHLMNLIAQTQFDTIYHEHYSYLSLHTVICIFQSAGLRVFHVEKLTTHGGSLRIFGCHKNDTRGESLAIKTVLNEEYIGGLRDSAVYQQFSLRVNKVKNDFAHFLIAQNLNGKRVAGYGAAAKGNTLLNYAGIKQDLLPLVADAASAKQGKYLPGSHIPICDPFSVNWSTFDFVVIFPWNIAEEVKGFFKDELKQDMAFVTAVPSLVIDK